MFYSTTSSTLVASRTLLTVKLLTNRKSCDVFGPSKITRTDYTPSAECGPPRLTCETHSLKLTSSFCGCRELLKSERWDSRTHHPTSHNVYIAGYYRERLQPHT